MTPETRRGLKEALGAVMAAIAVGLSIAGAFAVISLLTGCAGTEVYARFSHRSSIPDERDRNTSDLFGGCVEVPLGKSQSIYLPRMVGCVNWEVNDEPVYGRDPSGELSIKQPLWRKK